MQGAICKAYSAVIRRNYICYSPWKFAVLGAILKKFAPCPEIRAWRLAFRLSRCSRSFMTGWRIRSKSAPHGSPFGSQGCPLGRGRWCGGARSCWVHVGWLGDATHSGSEGKAAGFWASGVDVGADMRRQVPAAGRCGGESDSAQGIQLVTTRAVHRKRQLGNHAGHQLTRFGCSEGVHRSARQGPIRRAGVVRTAPATRIEMGPQMPMLERSLTRRCG
jgi:hypothetical protein